MEIRLVGGSNELKDLFFDDSDNSKKGDLLAPGSINGRVIWTPFP